MSYNLRNSKENAPRYSKGNKVKNHGLFIQERAFSKGNS
jgi:hypothetical protein